MEAQHEAAARFLRQAPLDREDFRRNIIRPARRFRPPAADGSTRWLDIGCSIASLLLEAHAAGYRPQGLELSRALVDWVRANRPRIPVLQGRLDALAGEQFDVVSADNVFEHIHDPGAFLDGLRQNIAPGGILLLRVPNFDTIARRWLQTRGRLPTSYLIDPDAHPFNYRAASLGRLLERHGYTVRRLDPAWVFSYPLRHVLAGRGLAGRPWAQTAFRLASLADGLCPFGGVDVTAIASPRG